MRPAYRRTAAATRLVKMAALTTNGDVSPVLRACLEEATLRLAN